MTERLYYSDSYLGEFHARVVERAAAVVYLDRTAFYPDSGGQPCDLGTIAGIPVVEVTDEGERIAHRLAAPLAADEAACAIDWERRWDHMQQHSGQHLLSAVLAEAFGLRTVSFHLGRDVSTIDLEGGSLDARAAAEAERRANRTVCENRPLSVSFEDSGAAAGLRKASEREGTLRVVSIEGLDRSACGGTHVRSTGEIGLILLRKTEKVRNTVRVEFLCGARAAARARADFDSLTRAAQHFSAQLDEVPGLVAAQLEAARAAEKTRRKLELDLAGYRGRELWAATPPGADGLRRIVQRSPSGSMEELRPLAQSFTAQSRAVFLAVIENPPSLMLAVSEDSGIDAGRLVKQAVTEAGGRGGGAARIAQGSVPDLARLEAALARIG